MIPPGYTRVTPRNRCLVCERPEWCLNAIDRLSCFCWRIHEGAKRPTKAGYFHVLSHDYQDRPRPPARHRVAPPPTINAAKIAAQLRWDIDDSHVLHLAAQLGVSTASLNALCLGWTGSVYGFPMQDDAGTVIGIRTRHPTTGEKRCITGSRNGLFVPAGFEWGRRAMVVEGPTDTAAMYDLGYAVFGRPNCSACVDMVVEFCCRHRIRELVNIANFDEKKTAPDGREFWPGQEGAERLGEACSGAGVAFKMVYPLGGVKDARAWRRNGATRATVDSVIENARWWSKRKEVVTA